MNGRNNQNAEKKKTDIALNDYWEKKEWYVSKEKAELVPRLCGEWQGGTEILLACGGKAFISIRNLSSCLD